MTGYWLDRKKNLVDVADLSYGRQDLDEAEALRKGLHQVSGRCPALHQPLDYALEIEAI